MAVLLLTVIPIKTLIQRMKSAKTVDYRHGCLPSQYLCLSCLIKVNELNFEKFIAFKVERVTDNYVTMIVLLLCRNQLCKARSQETNKYVTDVNLLLVSLNTFVTRTVHSNKRNVNRMPEIISSFKFTDTSPVQRGQ